MRPPFSLAAALVLTLNAVAACGPPCGGGSLNLAVTNYSTNNTANHAPYQPSYVSGRVPTDRTALTIQSALCVSNESPNRSMTIFLHGAPAAATTYNVTTVSDGSDTYVQYSEGPTNGSPTARWRGRAGSVTIDTIQGSVLTFHLTGVLFEPDPMQSGMGMGTFQYDGTGRIESVVGLP